MLTSEPKKGHQERESLYFPANRVAREVALPSPHTTKQAGPHAAGQAG